ncbi:DUF4439 domain-containing protein [Pseudonocardiaceae bacterium YIM PH 21723]|nr:DUF4439 domain-containing protein [Pseudonocardiaceae bacterium YIM PH 21723]
MTSPSSSQVPVPAGPAVDAVQQALAAEHAASWSYGLVSAFLGGDYASALGKGRAAHDDRRELAAAMIRRSGGQPVPAQASYQPPKPVTDAKSALALVVTMESATAAAWRAVLERTEPGSGLRAPALAALTDSATRGTRWRIAAGVTPAAEALPGTPTG